MNNTFLQKEMRIEWQKKQSFFALSLPFCPLSCIKPMSGQSKRNDLYQCFSENYRIDYHSHCIVNWWKKKLKIDVDLFVWYFVGIQDLLGEFSAKIYSKKIRDTFSSIASSKINPKVDRCVAVSSKLINYVVATTLRFDRCNYLVVEDHPALTSAIRFFACDTSRGSRVMQEKYLACLNWKWFSFSVCK